MMKKPFQSYFHIFSPFIGIIFFSLITKSQSLSYLDVQLKRKIDSTYISLIEKYQVKGLSLAIIDSGKVVFSNGYGWEDVKKKIPATSKSVYRIGSITKSFTALSILQLQNKGLLSVNDDLKTFIPEFSIGFQKDIPQPLIIKNVMSHTSGLPGELMNGIMSENPPSFNWIIEQSKHMKMSYPPKYLVSYSNLGYALLGEVVKRVSGKNYEDYLIENVLSPLKMTSTYLFPNEGHKTPLSYLGNELIEEPIIRDVSAGMIHSNVEDMASYLLMLMGNVKDNQYNIIDSLSRLEMISNQTDDVVLKSNDQFGYGLNSNNYTLFSNSDSTLVNVIGHRGDTYTFHADMKFIPELGIGVIVLTNSNHGSQINSGEQLLRTYLFEKNRSILSETPIYPKPVVKSDFEKGVYAFMNSKVVVNQEKKIRFSQGPIRVIAKNDKDGLYHLKAWVLGFIPISIKNQVFFFERINGRVIIKRWNKKDNSVEIIGTKIDISPISKCWKNSYGEYRVMNAIPCEECKKIGFYFNHITLKITEKDGLISFEFQGKNSGLSKKILAQCESENYAISIGLRRNNGETFKILENGNVFYNGFEFKRFKD